MVHISGCLFAWQAVLWKFGSKFGRGKSEGTLAASGQTYLPLASRKDLLPQKLCRTYLLCGYGASSLTQGLEEVHSLAGCLSAHSCGGCVCGVDPVCRTGRPGLPLLHHRLLERQKGEWNAWPALERPQVPALAPGFHQGSALDDVRASHLVLADRLGAVALSV